ncbi:hypothetical protein MNBD_GAMMA15-1201 [hydrothermal vent metagenome]|uniref:Peptidase C51 domain-containing protein n=1 Tax=hydrothermal vent metagenome TaxID=652676 RepID=A0A3B0YUK8_9ZZZZ
MISAVNDCHNGEEMTINRRKSVQPYLSEQAYSVVIFCLMIAPPANAITLLLGCTNPRRITSEDSFLRAWLSDIARWFKTVSSAALLIFLAISFFPTSATATAYQKGDRVKVTSSIGLNVRSCASVSCGKIPLGAPARELGTIQSGPTSGSGYTWWYIYWNNGVTGYSVQSGFALVTATTLTPSLSNVSPPSYPALAGNQMMTLSGGNFESGDTLTFYPPQGGSIASRASKLSFVNRNRLSYQFNNLNDAGTWSVKVNSPSGAKHSSLMRFTVVSKIQPATLTPSLSNVSPPSYPALAGNQMMTLSGGNFESGDTLTFYPPQGGSIASRASKLSFVNRNRLSYQFNNLNDAGTWSVKVNSPSGAKHSSLMRFTVVSKIQPATLTPSLSNVSPPSYPALAGNQMMTLSGGNFESGDTLTFYPPQGGSIASRASKLSFVNRNRLSYQFNNLNDAGTWSVKVNSPGGARHSGTVSFMVVRTPPVMSQPKFSSRSYTTDNIFWKAGYAPASTYPPGSSSKLGNSAKGNCTWYVNGRLRNLGYNSAKLDRLSGNASKWAVLARKTGIPVDKSPAVGAIAQLDGGKFSSLGHVAVVERINSDGTIIVSESSYSTKKTSPWNFLWRLRTVSPTWFSNFIHIPLGTTTPAATVDIQPLNVRLSSSRVVPGGTLKVSWKIRNNGAAAAASSNSQVRITNSPTGYGSKANNVGSAQATGTIAANGGVLNQSATVTVPTALGTYYVWVIADNNSALTQSNASNDFTVSGTALTVAAAGTVSAQRFVVNGHILSKKQMSAITYVGTHILPQLKGTLANKVTIASRVSWWSLKEGVFSLANPYVYSNCHTASGDVRLGPLGTCDLSQPWQVGFAAVQVPYHNDQSVLNALHTLWPGRPVTDVLGEAARIAGFGSTTGTGAAIVASTGYLKRSWLLRHPVIGMYLEEPTVTAECINAAKSWCYGTGWTETRDYAATRQDALQSVSDIASILTKLTTRNSTLDTVPPTISAFTVSPFASIQGQSITINYTVSDTGGSGLNHVVLRRTSGSGSASDPGWQGISTNLASGNGPVSGSFSDTPPRVGTYHYEMAVFDSSGNSKNERQSGREPVPVAVSALVLAPLVIKDSTGAALTTKQTVAPTGSLTVTPGGGSGRFAALITSPANVVTNLTADTNGKYTFTPPTSGAFAGDYTLTLTDVTSGLSTTLAINVPLKMTASRLNILKSDHTQTITVSGGAAYDEFSVVVLDVAKLSPNGKPMPDTNLNKIAANIPPIKAVSDAAKGNPATATIVPANVTAITPFAVLVTDYTQPAFAVAQSRRMNIIAENLVTLTVTDANNKSPIKGATVAVRLPDSIIAKANATTTTDAQGVATPTLPIGPLVFNVTATGYLPGTITLAQGATIEAVALTPIYTPVTYAGTINVVAPFTLPTDTQVIAVDVKGNKIAVKTGSATTFTLTLDTDAFVPVQFVATANGAISDAQLAPAGGTVIPAFTLKARPAAVPGTALNADVVTGKPTANAGGETFTAGAPAGGASGATSIEVLSKPTAAIDKAKPLAAGSVTVRDNQPVIEVLVKGRSIISAPVVYQKLVDTRGNERRKDAGTKPMVVGGAAAVTFSIPALTTVSNVEVYLPVNAFKVTDAAGNALAVDQIFTTVSGVVATSTAGQDKAKLTGGDIVEIDMVAFDGVGNVFSTAVDNTNLDRGMEIRIPIDPNALAAAGFDATTANAAFASGKLVINTAPTIADFEAGKVMAVPGPVIYDPLTGEAVFFARHFSAFGAAAAPASAPTTTPGTGAVASGGGSGCTLTLISPAPGKIDPLLALLTAISLWWRRRRQS